MAEQEPRERGTGDGSSAVPEFDLGAEQRRMRELDRAIAEETTTVRSKDRSLSMTFDGRGELSSMAFNGSKYRSMAPAELAHVIVETLQTGRARAMEKLTEQMGPASLPGVDIAGLASGRASASEVFESLLSPMLDDALSDLLPEQGTRSADREERGRE